MLVGHHVRMSAQWWQILLGLGSVRQEEERSLEMALELLDLVGLSRRYAHDLAKNLPYGDQRRLEIARALASHPKLLLLDEPTAGMNPAETRQMTDLIARLRRELGLTVVLIEHDMKVVMGISERITVLDHGELLAEGLPEEIRADPQGRRGLPRHAGDRAHDRHATNGGREPLLELRDLHVFYGNIEALKGISLTVGRGEVVTLIGSNGAGKSTALRAISSTHKPRSGQILLDGKPIHHLPPHEVVALGVAQSPEGRRVFARMTVYENLQMGAYSQDKSHLDR